MACSLICKFVFVVGCAYLAYLIYCFVRFVYVNYFTTVDYKTKYARAGKWAIITGATDGIGYAYARDLAKRGVCLYLIARSEEKLKMRRQELLDEFYKVGKNEFEVKMYVFDFGSATNHDWKKMGNQILEIEKIECCLLVNNVGINILYPTPFSEVDLQKDMDIVSLNTMSSLRMTKMILPHMQERKCGAIVFMSSFSALHPTPFLSQYAGSKAFIKGFGEGLYLELKRDNIDVLIVTPNVVISKMTAGLSNRRPSKNFIMVDTDEMAHATLNKMGHTMITCGHPHHDLFEGLLKFFCPDFLIHQQFIKTGITFYQKAKRREAREAAKAQNAQ